MIEVNKIYQGDCLELMKGISDKSVDMILCDLPYGTTACEWDKPIPFTPMWKEYKRILKLDGVIALFGNQPFTSELICSNKDWYSHIWVWDKNNGSNYALAKQQPLKVTEDIVIFKRNNNHSIESFKELKGIFKKILETIGKNKTQIIKELGHGLDHCFRINSLQWGLPTEENYIRLVSRYDLTNVPNYKELKDMYNSEFRNRYNPPGLIPLGEIKKRGSNAKHFGRDSRLNTKNIQTHTNYPKNILEFTKTKEDKSLHPTQKPVNLLEYLIKTYTHEGELILDNCIGSGSTAIACINTNRNFIGMEKDKKIFEVCTRRVNRHYVNKVN